ncbi:MAG: Na(+)-translocating NADH-quinone reductase subunit A [Bacteroidota bacterium]
MRNGTSKFVLLAYLLLLTFTASAQSSNDGSSYFYLAMLGIVGFLAMGVILLLSDNLLRIKAKEMGVDGEGRNFSLFPSFSELFQTAPPKYTKGANVTHLKKGYDIHLEGAAESIIDESVAVATFAVKPGNFVGMSPIPKIVAGEGTEVKAGDVLFFDKKRPEIKYVAPVSGEVLKVNRGAKRSIAEVVILADKEVEYRELPEFDLDACSRQELVDYLLDSGAWTMIRQRPYDIIADPVDVPKAIFVSTFDTAPLAPDLNVVVEGRGEAFQRGLDALKKLTPGKVHLGLDAGSEESPSTVFTEAQGVELNWFNGPHPAGNVGVQIHHIDPIAATEKVWVLGVQEVITIGAIFSEGRFNAERVVALTGAELKEPRYVATFLGANIENFVKDGLVQDHVRYVSGDVLSGSQISSDGFLNYYDDQITVLEEGDTYELFGWLLPLSPRPSVSKTFPNGLFDMKFRANTNTHGEKRAFVVTGQYESMLPMDIYPQHLIKSILVNDFERMEGLGIYELSEEDLALCEFACTSKQPLQKILREGLEMMRDQG